MGNFHEYASTTLTLGLTSIGLFFRQKFACRLIGRTPDFDSGNAGSRPAERSILKTLACIRSCVAYGMHFT